MHLTIDLVSDLVCPWCFIGKRNLHAAQALLRIKHPECTTEIRWHPFFLNPNTPPEGEPYRAFLENKFGGPDAVEALWKSVSAAGGTAGVSFAFDRIERRPQILLAHRLLHRSQTLKHSTALTGTWAERLFVGHFQRGEDIGSIEALVAMASEVGDDPESVRTYLNSNADTETVLAQAKDLQSKGISGVPFFIFNGKLAVSGAQAPTSLCAAMEESL